MEGLSENHSNLPPAPQPFPLALPPALLPPRASPRGGSASQHRTPGGLRGPGEHQAERGSRSPDLLEKSRDSAGLGCAELCSLPGGPHWGRAEVYRSLRFLGANPERPFVRVRI